MFIIDICGRTKLCYFCWRASKTTDNVFFDRLSPKAFRVTRGIHLMVQKCVIFEFRVKHLVFSLLQIFRLNFLQAFPRIWTPYRCPIKFDCWKPCWWNWRRFRFFIFILCLMMKKLLSFIFEFKSFPIIQPLNCFPCIVSANHRRNRQVAGLETRLNKKRNRKLEIVCFNTPWKLNRRNLITTSRHLDQFHRLRLGFFLPSKGYISIAYVSRKHFLRSIY